MVVVLALAAFLAWLGRLTPSPLPVVTLGNVAGGFLMLGLLAWLAAALRASRAAEAPLRGLALTLLAVACVQVYTGPLIASRLAACSGSCTLDWFGTDWHAFDPFFPAGAEPVSTATAGALHALHRVFGALLVAGALWLGWRALRRGDAGWAPVIACLALVQAALGLLIAAPAQPLWAAVAHNGVAALMVALLFAYRARGVRTRSARDATLREP
jgi:cytochrome c oxidase assembly protein subunit 15